jgi:hypothetical protein
MRGRALASVLLGLAVSAGALYLAGRRVDPGAVGLALSQARVGPLLATLGTGALAYVLLGVRSRILFAPVAKFRLSDHVRGHLVAFCGNALLPLRLGELMRIDFLARTGGVRHSACVGGLVVERLLDLAFMLGCLAASLPLTTGALGSTGAAAVTGAVVAAGLSGLVLLRRYGDPALRALSAVGARLGPRIAAGLVPRATAFLDGLSGLSSTRRLLAIAGLTVLRWSVAFVTIRLWLSAFDVELAFYAPVLLLAALAFGTALPAATAFVGTFHAALAGGLLILGLDESRALSVAIAAHAFATLPWLAVGLFVVLRETATGRLGGFVPRAAGS